MNEYIIAPAPDGYLSDALGPEFFGANNIFTRDFLDAGGPYDRLATQLNFTDFRFPGGTVTEEIFAPGGLDSERFFNTALPSGLPFDGGERMVTAPAMFDYATGRGAGVHFVLPTDNYLEPEPGPDGHRDTSPFGTFRLLERVDQMIRGEFGEVDLKTITIGNEFWYLDERQTPEEYARIVNDLAIGLQRVFDNYRLTLDDPDAWQEPDIAVQAGRGWRPDENAALIDAITTEARGIIDVVEQHFYPAFYHAIANSSGVFDRMDDFARADGFGDLDFFMSEWNVTSAREADMGLAHASNLIEMVRVMAGRGIDAATVWGTQYANLQSRLAALVPDPDAPSGQDFHLTPGGEVFRMLSSGLVGTRALDVDTGGGLRNALNVAPADRTEATRDQAVLHAFEGPERTIVFLSSRSDQPIDFTLNPHFLLEDDPTHVWAQRLSVLDDPATPDVNEGDPLSRFARPHITTYSEAAMADPSGLRVTLGAFEIVRFEFTTAETGVRMAGHDQQVDAAASYGDALTGTAHADEILGHFGNDTLHGAAGDDRLDGGVGNDQLFGGEGDDILISGSGADTLDGGAGDDTLIADDGRNVLTGGEGTDHFVVDTAGDTTLHGFDPAAGETISFLHAYATAEELLARVVAIGADLVVVHDGGGQTVLRGMADGLSALPGALADLQADGALAPVVAEKTAPQPRGAVLADPGSAGDVLNNAVLDNLGFEEVLNAPNPAALQAELDTSTDAQLIEYAANIDPDILLLTVSAPTLATFLNHLPDVALDDFFERMLPGAIDLVADGIAGPAQAAPAGELPDIRPDILLRLANAMGGESRGTFFDTLVPQQIDDIEAGLAAAGMAAPVDLLDLLGLTPVLLTGGAGDDQLIGGDGADTLTGGGGNNVLRGLGGADTLQGGDGRDTLNGGSGDDLLVGGLTEADGADLIFAGTGADTVDGGHGDDEIHGMDGDDLLRGAFGTDTLVGGTGDDTLSGGQGADVLFGGDGDDFLNGGFGFDRLNGGDGADRFFHLGLESHATDWIQDYVQADGDVLDFGGAASGADAFAVQLANTPGAGDADVAEVFVHHVATGQILWALVDGAAQDAVTVGLAGSDTTFELTF